MATKGHFLTLCGQTGSVCSPVTVGVRDPVEATASLKFIFINNQHVLTQLQPENDWRYFLLIRDLGLDYQGF